MGTQLPSRALAADILCQHSIWIYKLTLRQNMFKEDYRSTADVFTFTLGPHLLEGNGIGPYNMKLITCRKTIWETRRKINTMKGQYSCYNILLTVQLKWFQSTNLSTYYTNLMNCSVHDCSVALPQKISIKFDWFCNTILYYMRIVFLLKCYRNEYIN